MNRPMPRQPAPSLSVELTSGERWTLSEQDPDNFTLIVFYRGLHCPVCKKYLQELTRLQEDYAQRGTDVVAISMDSAKRARKAVQDWNLGSLPVGYGLTEEQAEHWGLYLSESIKDAEPALFSEPGLFLVQPDGTLYYVAINSMPFGRPSLPKMLESIDFILENDYPARGEVGAGVQAL